MTLGRSLAVAVLVAACGHHSDRGAGGKGTAAPVDPAPAGAAKLVVTSSAFAARAEIPTKYTCEGENVDPPLSWSGAPAGTKSFAIVVDDPDAPDPAKPERTWVHWVVVRIPPTVTSLPEGVSAKLPGGAVNGTNDFGKVAWGGPCPPTGRHRYFFKVYALDAVVGTRGMTKAQVLAAIKGHVLAHGALIGMYQKKS